MKSYIKYALLLIVCFSSCKKFLNESPNGKQVQITTIKDCQALLDDFNTMNASYPNDAEAVADNYLLEQDVWAALPNADDRELYIWSAKAQRLTSNLQWASPYKVVYYSNLVLETLSKLKNSDQTMNNTVRGSALFFRAFAFYNIAQLYAKPFSQASTNQDLGIPIRQTTALEVESERATVKQTYDQILDDLNQAISLLPINSSVKTRPNKVSAYGMLARVYLSMGDYVNAGKASNECLKLYSSLMDYNQFDASAIAPIGLFNDEVIFHANTTFGNLIDPVRAKIDESLINTYSENDLRKNIFFSVNDDGSHSFKGNYNGLASSILFTGLATDEIYLIRAECNARVGNFEIAMVDLNKLLKTRWNPNATVPSKPYTDLVADNAEDALKLVLMERRKELIFRCVRWTDLRRLNMETRFQIRLTRTINNKEYSLAPNDLRYVLLIPQDVMNLTNFQQNPRQPN